MSKKLKNPANLVFPILREPNFTANKIVSYSQYNTWLQCPHKWYLTQVEKKSSPPNINLVFGSAIHHTIQLYLKQMYEVSGVEADKLNLNDIFETKYTEEYQKEYDKNKKIHFSNPIEMREFYNDGVEILKWFKSHRKQYFSTRNCYLIGVELPIQTEIVKNIIFMGYIDLVLYDKDLDKIFIYDFKTSTKGWNKWNKKDDNKLSQLLLYKKYFSELYRYPIDKIDVEFLVLKRKVEANEFVEFPKRIQSIKPASGKIKISQAINSFDQFLKDCFNGEGIYNNKEYTKNISKLCEYCVFNNTSDCIK